MRRNEVLRFPGLAVAVMLALSSCATAPKRDLEVERIAATLQQLERDADLAPRAPAEIARARDALRDLQAAGGANAATRANLAYIAERRVDVAAAAARAARDTDALDQLEGERAQILVEASRRDAQAAREEAERLRMQNLARVEEADRAREQAAAALEQSELSAQQAQSAREAAEQAKRLAQAQAQEASLAKREAELAMAAADSLRIQMQNLKSRQDSRGQVMTLGESVFPPGKSSLQPEALANLDTLVGFVNENTQRRVRIEGHTDNRGGSNLNQVLSQKRAEAVRDALVERGVDGARITAVGMGASVPIAPNDSAEGRARNRRVEVILEAH